MANKVIEIENAKLLWRNFSGAEGPFNREGRRSFHVVLEDEALVEQLVRDGWNVRTRDKNKEYDPITTLEVHLRFDKLPPNIYLITDPEHPGKKTRLDEDNVGLLDYADIVHVDLVINPGYWETNGKSGIKAWLRSMYVTIQQDKFAQKYMED